MNKEDKFLFYQLNPLKRLKEQKPKDKGIKEKHIENLFCQNLENIFSGWISLSQQQYLGHPDKKEGNCIIDSLAFDKSSRNFLVIEYKKEMAAELVYQVEKYMECLEDEEKGVVIRNRNKLLDILNNNENFKKQRGTWKEKEIEWGETKSLCITTEIHGYQTILKRKPHKNVHVLEIKFYEEKFLSIDCEKLPDWLSIEKKQKDTVKNYSKGGKKNELDYSQSIEEITKLEWISSNIKQWLIEIDNSFNLLSINLSREISARNKNDYPVINYKFEKTILSSVVVKVSQINIYWNFRRINVLSNDNLLELLKRCQVEYKETNHRGKGNWHFPLINGDDSCQHLKKFIQDLEKLSWNKLKSD